MRLRACFALLLFLSACTTTPPSPREPAARDPRLAHLQRAAKLPWTDGGQCAVREASEPWPVLAERCFYALDHDRVRFRDITGRCAVASAGAAVGVGLCVLAAPEIIVGAVIVAGGGVSFDALQAGVRVLWEIKTHQFDTYNAFVRRQEIDKEMKQLNKQRKAAAACGYDFVVGVSTQAHKDALLQRDQFLNIVVTGCKR